MSPSRRLCSGLLTLAGLSALLTVGMSPLATAASAAAPGVATTGGTWAGYIVTGSTYTSVVGTWTQPALKCTSGDQYASIWVGLDGYSSPTVEQVGVEADCTGKTAAYSAWYDMYPAYPVTFTNTVRPGDSMTASVVFSGTETYTLTIKDSTEGWTKTTVKMEAGLQRSSAECVVDDPESGVYPLADFGSFSFTSCVVNGAPISSGNTIVGTMPGVTVSPVDSGHLTITWVS